MLAVARKINGQRSFEAVIFALLIELSLLIIPATAKSQLEFASGEIELVGTKSGNLVIAVEFASEEVQRRHGLMHREKLASGTGMLFIYENEGMRAFWMKNTIIPLDIVFFDGAGRFASVYRDVTPLTLTLRRASAQYVLELNSGEAEKLGIGPKTRLLLPIDQ